ncbi:Ig-like domain-containing protein [Rahnella bruchi]|uniref:Ig-like domain-containing protein n=1 Tax=Rahnella bruchi TaxID=1510573 RepID=UPI0013C50A78|nr:Ig-like domain-containing protein [Rahnella bruchi]
MSADTQFYLKNAEDNFAPENITLKREGNNLSIFLKGEDEPVVLIEDYYAFPNGKILGYAEDGQFYAYQLVDGGNQAGQLMSGEAELAALGGDAIGANEDIFQAENLGGVAFLPWFLGALGLGAATAAAVSLSNNKKDSGNATDKVPEPENKLPEKPMIKSVSDNVGAEQVPLANGSLTDDATPTFSGTGQPGCLVTIYANGKVIGSTQVDKDGNWAFTPAMPLTDGHHQIVVTQTDSHGNTSAQSPTFDFDVDTTAPAKPSIGAINDNQGSLTGPLHNGDATDDDTPTLSGRGNAGDTVTIYDNGQVIGKVVVDKDGNWSFTPAPALKDGDHKLSIDMTDPAGHRSEPSDVITITVDSVAPSKPSIGGVTDEQGNSLQNGGETDDSTPTLSGKGEPGDTVTIYDGDEKLGDVTIDDNGNWSFTPEPPLNDGEHNLSVDITDPAGNHSDLSDTITIIVDTTKPAKPVIGGVYDNEGSQTGPLHNGDATDDTTPTLSGRGSAGDIVTIYDNGQVIGKTIVDKNGHWSFTPEAPLADGEHKLNIVITDSAQNSSEPSDIFTVVVDTVAPAQPSIGGVTDDAGSSLADGAQTNDDTPTLSGQGEPGDTVTIYDGEEKLGEVTIDDNGSWSFTPEPPLGDGEHNLSVDVTDPAGNRSEPSETITIVVDTVAPAQPSIGGVTDDAGSSLADGAQTNDDTPTLSGQGEPGDTVTIYDGEEKLGEVTIDDNGSWSFTPEPPLGDGEHNLSVEFTDPAGNRSESSDVITITVDTEAPTQTVTITNVEDDAGVIRDSVANNGITDDSTPTLTGTVSNALREGERVQIWCNDILLGTAVVTDTGWSFEITSPLPDDEYRFEARVVDEAGNSSAPSNEYVVTIDTVAPLSTPEITSVLDDQQAIVGEVDNEGITNDSTPTLHGNGAESNGLVYLYDNGQLIGSVRADDKGDWSYTPEEALSEGKHQFTAANGDEAGNTGVPSPIWEITVDTVAPAATVTISELVDNVGPIHGYLESGAYTDDTTPTLQFTLSDQLEAGERIEISRNGEIVGFASWNQDHWEFTDNALEDGDYLWQARVVDAAGNAGTWSTPFETHLTSQAPVAKSIITDISDDTGSSDSDFITSDKILTLHGELTEALKTYEKAQISFDDGKSWIDLTVVDGKWSYADQRQLTDQSWTWNTRVINEAGVASEANSVTVLVDTIAPSNTTTLALDKKDDTGVSDSDNKTSVVTPTVHGTVSSGSDTRLDTLKVVLFDDLNNNGRLDAGETVFADDIAVNDKGEWTHDLYSLHDGTYNLKAAVKDQAGNLSNRSSSLKDEGGQDSQLNIDHNQTNLVKGDSASQLGWNIASAGDFNGDGIDDLIVNAQYANTAGRTDNGATWVLYGSAEGLPDLNKISELKPEQGVRFDGAAGGDRMGFIVNSLKDFNGDGYDDVIIASHWNDKVYVVYGGPGQFNGSYDLKAIDNGDNSHGFVVRNAGNANEWLGVSASGGDINGDGYADLMIGNTSVGGDNGQGLIIYGKQGGYNNITLNKKNSYWYAPDDVHSTTILPQNQVPNTNDPSKVDSMSLGESFNAVGDVNGDGIEDFVISAPRSGNFLSAHNAYDAGTSYLLYGSKDGLPSELNLNNLTADQGIRIHSLHYEWAGGSGGWDAKNMLTKLGDINGDGVNDFAISAPYSEPYNPGRVYVIYGKQGGYGDKSLNLDVFPNASMTLPSGYQPTFSASDGFLLVNEKSSVTSQSAQDEWFGYSIRGAGDVNGDGIDDFIIGARYADGKVGNTSYTNNGAVYVVYGKDQQWGVNDVNGKPIFSIADIIKDPSQGYVLRGTKNNAEMNSVALGDWNGDGIADVAVGQPGSSSGDAGEYSVYYSTPDFSQVFTTGNDKLFGTAERDFLLGGDGDDLLANIGSRDMAMGGNGIDLIKIISLDFGSVAGGAGVDTLVLDGSNMVLDLNAKRSAVTGFEKFDLGDGNNTLKLKLSDVIRMGETDLVLKDGKKQLVISGENGNVELEMPGNNSVWVQGKDVSLDGRTYTSWGVSDNVEVLIENRIDII